MWTALSFALVAFALAGAVSDVRTHRIPNRLVLVGLVAAMVLRAAWGFEALWHGAAAMGLALALGFPLFALRAFGAGDVKFLAACAAFVGLPVLGNAALLTALAGGVLSIVIMIQRRVPLVVMHRMYDLLRVAASGGRAGERMRLQDEGAIAAPYGVAIAAGMLMAWFGTAGGWIPWNIAL